MKFLVPVGGVTDDRFGILVTPSSFGVPAGVASGLPWAADNQAFTKAFDPGVFLPWLEAMRPYRSTCLFVAVPDAVGDAAATLDKYREYAPMLAGWPLALVAQDGLIDLPQLSPDYSTLFVGGTTVWKMGAEAASLIQQARRAGKRVHIGRVNWRKRYDYFNLMDGSKEFTCDGTRTRYEGVSKTTRAWRGYMAQRPLHPDLFGGDSGG